MNSSFNTLSNVSLTIFQASNKPKGDQRNVTFDQFVELLTPQSGEKDGSGFSPATFKHNHRGRENLISIEMIVLDVEENKKTGEIPPDPKEVVERLIERGFHGVVYTTYNHVPDAPRYRVVLFLSKPMIFSHERNLRHFEHEVAREVTLKVANELGLSDLIDTSKLGGESLFFFPRYPSIGGEHAKLFLSPGEPLNTSDLWRECQKKVAVIRNQNARQKEPSMFDQRAFRTQDLINKLRSHLPPLEQVLSGYGYTYCQTPDRYIHPSSSSKLPGVVIFTGNDGVQRYYSFHASDPLCGERAVFGAKAHDVIDVVIAHRFGTDDEAYRKGLRILARECGIEGELFFEKTAERYPLSEIASTPNQVRFSVSPVDYKSLFKVPRREKLYGSHLVAGYLSVIVAPGGMGKSSLLLAEAVDMASGGKVFGRTQQSVAVLYWNGEDPFDELQRRVAAICKVYNITEEDLGSRLFLSSGRNSPLVIGAETREGVQINEPVIGEFKAEIQKYGIRIVMIDPFVSCHQVDENNNRRIDQIAKTLSKLAEETKCAIELVHHVRKIGPDVEITANDSRGASSLIAAARTVRVLNRASEADLANLQRPGEEGNARSYFRILNDKTNMAPPADKSDWYQIKSVQLDNGEFDAPGDSVGVICRAEVISAFEGLSVGDLKKFQCALKDAGEKGLAYNQQAQDWAGYALAVILGRDPSSKAEKRRLKQIIDRYIDSKVVEKRLVKKPGKSEHQPRLFCGEAA
jgi:hypothetical protein